MSIDRLIRYFQNTTTRMIPVYNLEERKYKLYSYLQKKYEENVEELTEHTKKHPLKVWVHLRGNKTTLIIPYPKLAPEFELTLHEFAKYAVQRKADFSYLWLQERGIAPTKNPDSI